FARACELLWSGRTWMLSGTAVMTSIRVIATDAVDRPLPLRARPERRLGNQRGYTTCRVHRPGGEPVTVTSIHLSLDADERVDHTRRLLTGLAEDPLLAPGPHVVG